MINEKPMLKKRMLIMLICVGILFGGIFIYKAFMGFMMKRYMAANQSPTVTVSTMKVPSSEWVSLLKATGSSRAIKGVDVTTELAGMVQYIYFTPGAMVQEGDVLVQLKASTDIAQLQSLQANMELAQITYNRDKAQFAAQAISKATLDTSAANLKSLQAQVAEQEATVLKKTIRAPFTGRLGISAVNPGQFVNPGDKVVTLQSLDPIYVDFYVPQQALMELRVGQAVSVTIDTFPGKTFAGRITTINPIIDTATRNVEVEATVSNPQYEILPGMFATVTVFTGSAKRFLTLPQTAVSFNPYGEIVYIVQQSGKDKKGKPILIAKQRFVTTGETRGDQVQILQGLKEGDTVVTSGQLKLQNGSHIAINNAVVPANNPAPVVRNEH